MSSDRTIPPAVGRAALRATVAMLLAMASAISVAQDYPAKPVRVLVPNAPGSLNDSVARFVFAKVGESLGRQFVIDNRPGAGGNIAAEVVAKAPPDGYTLINAVNTILVVNPFLYSKLPYDPQRDFEPISMLVKISEVLVAHPSLGVKTVPELVALAKARPKQIIYASGGNGHPTHLMMELFMRKAGIDLVHVPYKGTPPAMQAVVSGDAAVFNIGIGVARPHIESGRVRALARTGFPSKDALQNVPVLTSFYPDAEYIPWQAAFAPKGTPRDVVAKLNGAIARALAAPDLAARLATLDLSAAAGSPAELDKAVRSEMSLNRDLVKSIGLKLD